MRTPTPALQTPSQTVGPYFSMILARTDEEATLAGPDVPGQRIRVTGRMLDGRGGHVEDGLLEVWQANAAGRYRHPVDDRDDIPLDPGFTGFGRVKTAFEDGSWVLHTVKPGPVPHPDGGSQAPHLNVIVQARGILTPSFTRIYFSDEEAANAADVVLQAVDADRRHTLIARRGDDDGDVATYAIDIRMQGDDETVFLDW
ncbi:protocatechuate 3,4-dioxygenase subunit alpha [Euzebya sp.]|uniref:protocatechuate 3,4-dioxygenase subunit alpha n=1 Tax=Euzebya sp. TaxID=1971409 RepID=UPI0035140280